MTTAECTACGAEFPLPLMSGETLCPRHRATPSERQEGAEEGAREALERHEGEEKFEAWWRAGDDDWRAWVAKTLGVARVPKRTQRWR